MKKMREVNYIFYMTLLYMLSSLYTLLNKGEVYELFDIEKLMKYNSLIIIVVGLGVIFLLVNYYRNTNQVLKITIFRVILPMVTILLGLNYPNFGLDGIIYAMVVYLIVTYIFMYPIIFCRSREEENDNNNNLKLYPSRKTQEGILSYVLENYNLIALDGSWGSGKTTFMDIFMREKKENYYYIPIDIMLFENKTSLKREFLNHLKEIFKNNGILEGTLIEFDHCLNGVSNDLFKVFYKVFISKSNTLEEISKNMRKEIKKINKKIVVGIDNLERIYSNSESEWKEIMGFIYELQGLGIKIVVMANLEKMLNRKEEEKIKQDKNDNYEYFDKFYEFKLKLNEVTTEEIIDEVKIKKEKVDQVEIKESTVDKEWLKEQVKELTNNINQGFDKLNEGGNNEDKEERNKKYSEYKNLHWRYLNGIKNPRKIEKLIKDIQTKQEKIRNIFNFIGEEDYKKLIFRTSLYEVMFFDCAMEHKKKIKIVGKLGKELKTDEFIKHPFSKMFFQAFGYSEFKDERAVNRLLYYDSKEDLIINGIKKLISTKEIDLMTIEKKLKDLEVYSSSLDPDYNKETTKKAYRIIEKKLIELEKTDEKRINEIIKENEGIICRLNYLTYPSEVGIFRDIKYKFNNEVVYMMYRKLEDILKPRRSRSRNELRDMLETINVYYYLKKENYIERQKKSSDVNLNEVNELIDKIKEKEDILKARQEKEVYSIDKAESIIYDMVLNFLMIIKSNMGKQEITIVEELKLGNWKEYDFKQKENLLNIVESNFENIKGTSRENPNSNLFKVIKSKSDLLKNIIEKEENQTIILKLADLIKTIEYRLVEFEILKKVSDINKEVDNAKKKNLREELLSFIKIKSKEERLQYMFNRQYWGDWMDAVEKIGIKEEEWNIKPQGEIEEERGEGVEEETEEEKETNEIQI